VNWMCYTPVAFLITPLFTADLWSC